MAENEQFTVDIEKFIKKAAKRCDKFAREFPQDLAEEIVKATPVKTGFLRGSWSAAISAPDGAPAIGGDALSRIALNLSRATAKDTIYINNNATYGPFVEFGTARMAERAFVRSTVARADQIAQNTLERIVKEDGG